MSNTTGTPVPHSTEGDKVRTDQNFSNPKIQAALANLVDALNVSSPGDAKRMGEAVLKDEHDVQQKRPAYATGHATQFLVQMHADDKNVQGAVQALLANSPDAVAKLRHATEGARTDFANVEEAQQADAARRNQQINNGQKPDALKDFSAQLEGIAMDQVERLRGMERDVRHTMEQAFKPLPPVAEAAASHPTKSSPRR